jgi:hypothetical protein
MTVSGMGIQENETHLLRITHLISQVKNVLMPGLLELWVSDKLDTKYQAAIELLLRIFASISQIQSLAGHNYHDHTAPLSVHQTSEFQPYIHLFNTVDLDRTLPEHEKHDYRKMSLELTSTVDKQEPDTERHAEVLRQTWESLGIQTKVPVDDPRPSKYLKDLALVLHSLSYIYLTQPNPLFMLYAQNGMTDDCLYTRLDQSLQFVVSGLLQVGRILSSGPDTTCVRPLHPMVDVCHNLYPNYPPDVPVCCDTPTVPDDPVPINQPNPYTPPRETKIDTVLKAVLKLCEQ